MKIELIGAVIDNIRFLNAQKGFSKPRQENSFKDRCFPGAVQSINQIFIFAKRDPVIFKVPESIEIKVLYNQDILPSSPLFHYSIIPSFSKCSTA
jgi:hypothetical protein